MSFHGEVAETVVQITNITRLARLFNIEKGPVRHGQDRKSCEGNESSAKTLGKGTRRDTKAWLGERKYGVGEAINRLLDQVC